MLPLEGIKLPREERGNPLTNYYKAKDGKWIIIVCLPDEPRWPSLCEALGRGDLEHHPKFSTRDKRLENNTDLIAVLDDIIQTKTSDEWGRILEAHGIVWTHIPESFEEVTKDPQVLANDHIVEVDHPSFGKAKILTTPIRLNKKAPPIRRLAPELGQHNEEILQELDYTWDDIAELKDKGVIL
jgi:crotonobetainyl-CoA:carnitine CoA-transferase CaiB-like acyl-CoA transferase